MNRLWLILFFFFALVPAVAFAQGPVTVVIGPDRRVPVDVTQAAAPRPLEPGATLVIRNESGAPLSLRFADDSGTPSETIALPPNEERTLAPADVLRLAGSDRLLTIHVVDPAAPESSPTLMQFVAAAAATAPTEERADDMQIRAAQIAAQRSTPAPPPPAPPPPPPVGAKKGPGGGPSPAPPPAPPATRERTLEVGVTEAPPAVKDKTRPLPIERIRSRDGEVRESLRLLATGRDVTVTFKDDRDRDRLVRTLAGSRSPADLVLSYDEISRLAGRDGDLTFTVLPAGGTEWTGYLTLNIQPLEIGRVFVPIDLTGVSDWRFVNPRTPARIGPNGTATLEFTNRVPGRTIKITFPAFPKGDLEKDFRDAGFELDCSRPKTCTPDLVLQAANRTVEAALLVKAYGGVDQEGLVEFKVAFFEGDVEPANSSGYLAVVARPYEPGFTASWNAAANAGFVRDAHFAGFTMNENEAPVINPATPFDDQGRWHMTGLVRLSLRPALGTRANAEVDLVAKEKDFGVADAPTVSTQRARVNVFGFNGASMSIGRYDFAAPTRAIAISESGEGFGGRWRRYSLSYIVRPREKLDKGVIVVPADTPAVVPSSPDARDRWSTLFQAQWAPAWVRVETSALGGRRKTLKGAEGNYLTVGADVIAANGFGQSTAIWRLNGGFYSSHRQAKASAPDATDADHGWAGLVDGTVAWLKDRTPRLTVGATAAMASRDDPGTPGSEAYAGESAAFVPDKIFLATLAGKVVPLTTVGPAGETETRALSGGLTGKKYLGAGFVYQGFSPLEWIAYAFGIPRSDVTTRSVTGRWQGYSLRNPVTTAAGAEARTWLGQEWSMELLLESPRGVRYTLTGARFIPGDLLKEQKLILSSTWYVDARVTLTLR